MSTLVKAAKAIGGVLAAGAAAVGIVVGARELSLIPPTATSSAPSSLSSPDLKDCKSLSPRQADAIVDMVRQGIATPDQGRALAESISCQYYNEAVRLDPEQRNEAVDLALRAGDRAATLAQSPNRSDREAVASAAEATAATARSSANQSTSELEERRQAAELERAIGALLFQSMLNPEPPAPAPSAESQAATARLNTREKIEN